MPFEFSIDRFSVASTYHNGLKRVWAYELTEPTSSPNEDKHVAKRLGVSVQTFRDYILSKRSEGGHKPTALQTVEYLEGLGLLPMNPGNPKFPVFHLLASSAFWVGGKSSGGVINRGQLKLYPRTEEQKVTIESVLRALGTNATYSPNSGGGSIDFDARIARMLGAFEHKGADQDRFEWPAYIGRAFDFFMDPANDAKQKANVLPILSDFIQTALFFRLSFPKGNPPNLSLNSHHDFEAARKDAERTRSLIQAVFGESVQTSIYGPHQKKGGHGMTGAQISFPGSKNALRQIVTEYPERVKKLLEEICESAKGSMAAE